MRPAPKAGAGSIMVVNAGSSSLKLCVLDPDDQVLARSDVDTSTMSAAEGIAKFLDQCPQPGIVAHRMVHGGAEFSAPVVLDDVIETRLRSLADLAPLQTGQALVGIDTLRRLRPDLSQAVCFDTAFHAALPSESATYALPVAWSQRWRLRRYGFHGLSHAYASRRAAELLGLPLESLRLVTAHIGSGASLAAVAGGRSVDTTMGFTPMDGLVMATRPGSLDPGLVLWLAQHSGLSLEELSSGLEHHSGLLGLSGRSGDLREVIAASDAGDPASGLAYRVYLHRLRALVAAMTAALAGLDALVFTGGAGEHSTRLRADTCAGLRFLGIELDPALNEGPPESDAVISGPAGSVAVLVVAAREDIEIARQVRPLMTAGRSEAAGPPTTSP
jgi:acetate kinase